MTFYDATVWLMGFAAILKLGDIANQMRRIADSLDAFKKRMKP